MKTGTGMVWIAGIYPDSTGEKVIRKGVTPGRQQRVKMLLWQDKCCIMMPENWVQLFPVTTTLHWKITSLELYLSWTHLGCTCRKSDGKMQNICHPQQGHANTKVTVGVADSQDFAMFWQLICHKCHSSPHKTIAFLWGGGGDRRKSDFSGCRNQYAIVSTCRQESWKMKPLGDTLDLHWMLDLWLLWGCFTSGVLSSRRGQQQSMTVK